MINCRFFLKITFGLWDITPEERPKLDTQAISVKKGDILIAKSYGSTSQSHYYVRAIGVVSDLEKPKDIPKEYL